MPPVPATNYILMAVGLVWIGCVLYFDIDRFLVIRVLGAGISGIGLWSILEQRVPFTEDEDDAGETPFVGWVAVVAGVIILAIGLFAAISPKWFMVFWSAVDGTPF